MASQEHSIFGLYGAGGFARETMPMARLCAKAKGITESFFVETLQGNQRTVNSAAVLTEEDFLQRANSKKFFNVAIADSRVRERIAQNCIAQGAVALNLHAEHSVIYDGNNIAEGAILCAQVTITSNIRIGRFFHANIYSYVGHDCIIGDFVTFAPRVSCNGYVHIGNHAYIGTGAVIRNGSFVKPLIIGEGAVIGMGAVVTKDVAPFATVIGNPAHMIKK